MGPFSGSDGDDLPGLLNEVVPGLAADCDDILVGCEHSIGEPIVAHELPDVFDRVQLRRARRQWHQGDIVWDDEFLAGVPAGLIEENHRMGVGIDGRGYLGQMRVHGLAIAVGHDQARRFAFGRADGAEETHGEQEGTAYNGHFGCTCYHPLFLFNQFGDLERCSLRPGNVHSADGWRNVLEPVVMRYKERKVRLYFRGDAAFASPEIYEYLEAEGLLYVIRLKANAILQRNIAHLLTRPVGRPPDHVRRFHASFSYQAGSWNKKRRVVAKVEWHPGELVPRVGFIVTNLSRPTKRVVAFYNHRGTAEQHIKEGKNAINWTRLSCRKFRNNAVRLQLHALAYNLGNFMRTLALPKEVEHWSMTTLPKEVEHWSMTTLRDKLVKIGAKVVRHGRYVTFQLAEVAVPRDLFRKILSLIDDLRRRPAPA